MMDLVQIGKDARSASRQLALLDSAQKDKALLAIADALVTHGQTILQANAQDLEAAKAKGMKQAMQDRLLLTEQRIADMAAGIREVAALPDPVGEVTGMIKRPNGLLIGRQRVPLGVIGIIYEARPNVTSDAAALCIKSGNAVILRGGSEALHSNTAIIKVMREAGYQAGLPEGCIGFVEDPSRETATALMRLNGYVDVLIPRGGAGLIKSVVEHASVPVIETGTGNCHVYVDDLTDLQMAKEIVINAKTSRPSVCNAEEKLLVHCAVAAEFLPIILPALAERGVEIRGDAAVRELYPDAVPATQEDWGTEYNDYIIGVKVVDSLEQAISHINTYGTMHSEAIVTTDYAHAQQFLAGVDAAAVYVNASTRFTDGNEFGLGAEIGISTQKMHARGPMGLQELTTVKYIIYGSGQIR